jgi:hypothetical protein
MIAPDLAAGAVRCAARGLRGDLPASGDALVALRALTGRPGSVGVNPRAWPGTRKFSCADSVPYRCARMLLAIFTARRSAAGTTGGAAARK